MTYDAASIKAEISLETRCEMLKALQDNDGIPEFLKEPGIKFEEVWVAGCWLNSKIRDDGADEAIVHKIGVAHGQYSFFGDPYKWAAILYNDYLNGKITEPGLELANKINNEHIIVDENGIQLKFEKF